MNWQQQLLMGGGGIMFLLGGASLLKGVIYKVDPGFLAIKFNKLSGLGDQVYSEGWNLKIPYLENPILYDVTLRSRTIECKTGSKDLQMVYCKMKVSIKPNIRKLPTIYRKLGIDYDNVVLPSVGNEVLKSVIARYSATQLMNQRDQVSAAVRDSLQDRLQDFNIEVGELAINDLTFSQEFRAAVENKQIAQAEADRAKFMVARAIEQKKQIIIKAQGEAMATQLYGEKMQQSPVFMELKRIEAARSIARIVGTGQNRVFLDSDTLMMNLTQGFNQNLEKKSAADYEYERLKYQNYAEKAQANLSKLKK